MWINIYNSTELSIFQLILILLHCQNFTSLRILTFILYEISYNSKKHTRVWNYHIPFKNKPADRAFLLDECDIICIRSRMCDEGINTNSVAIVHELRYIIGMNIEKLAVKLRVNLDASRRPRCLRAETCCGQLSSPFLPPPPPYSPIAATSSAKLYEYSRLSGTVTMSRSQRRSRASASDSHAERKAARKGRGNNETWILNMRGKIARENARANWKRGDFLRKTCH